MASYHCFNKRALFTIMIARNLILITILKLQMFFQTLEKHLSKTDPFVCNKLKLSVSMSTAVLHEDCRQRNRYREKDFH